MVRSVAELRSWPGRIVNEEVAQVVDFKKLQEMQQQLEFWCRNLLLSLPIDSFQLIVDSAFLKRHCCLGGSGHRFPLLCLLHGILVAGRIAGVQVANQPALLHVPTSTRKIVLFLALTTNSTDHCALFIHLQPRAKQRIGQPWFLKLFLLEQVAEALALSMKRYATEDQTLRHNLVNISFSKIDQLGLVGKCADHSFRKYMGCYLQFIITHFLLFLFFYLLLCITKVTAANSWIGHFFHIPTAHAKGLKRAIRGQSRWESLLLRTYLARESISGIQKIWDTLDKVANFNFEKVSSYRGTFEKKKIETDWRERKKKHFQVTPWHSVTPADRWKTLALSPTS